VKLVLAALIVVGTSGCYDRLAIYADIARTSAGEASTCPVNRIAVSALPPSSPPVCPQAGPPPPDIAADAERAALWNQQQRRYAAECEEPADFAVAACGRSITYHCARTGHVRCHAVPATDGPER
jgi:hypothetical protein